MAAPVAVQRVETGVEIEMSLFEGGVVYDVEGVIHFPLTQQNVYCGSHNCTSLNHFHT